MRLRVVTLALLLLVIALGLNPTVQNLVIQRARLYAYQFRPTTILKANPSKTSHLIAQKTLFGTNFCSATAIGKHALLTASHCELASDDVSVDGGAPIQIVARLRDGNDHSIYLLNGITFPDVATFSPSLEQGEEVFMFGNPRGLRHLYRHGFYAGTQRPPGKDSWPDVLLFDLNIGPGDSGAAVYNSKQEIVAVVSMMFNPGDISLASCFPLKFTEDQLKLAREY